LTLGSTYRRVELDGVVLFQYRLRLYKRLNYDCACTYDQNINGYFNVKYMA